MWVEIDMSKPHAVIWLWLMVKQEAWEAARQQAAAVQLRRDIDGWDGNPLPSP